MGRASPRNGGMVKLMSRTRTVGPSLAALSAFYSTFGHAPETWDNPQIQKMYFEATRWALRLTGDDVAPGNATSRQ